MYSLINNYLQGKGQQRDDDKFTIIKNSVQERIYAIRKKQQERDEKLRKTGASADTIKINHIIKDQIAEVQKELGQMNEVLRKQKKEKNVVFHI